MGRKHHTEQIPQHSRHAREKGRRQRGEVQWPEAFGVRRSLDQDIAARLRFKLSALKEARELPDTLKIKKRPRVLLLPLEFLGEQADQGLISAGCLRSMRRELEANSLDSAGEKVHVDLEDVKVPDGRSVAVTFASPTLVTECSNVVALMDRYKIRGVQELQPGNTFSVQVARTNRVLKLVEREEVAATLKLAIDEALTWEEPWAFNELDVYPGRVQLAA